MANLASQQDTYLRELQKTHASLQEVQRVLSPFNLPRYVGIQAVHLSRAYDENTRDLDLLSGSWNSFLDKMVCWLNRWKNASLWTLGQWWSLLKMPYNKWSIFIIHWVSRGSNFAQIKLFKTVRLFISSSRNPLLPSSLFILCIVNLLLVELSIVFV